MLKVERERIELTCTWPTVCWWVRITFQKRPSVKVSRFSSQKLLSIFVLWTHLPHSARKHRLETFESRTARALAPLCSYFVSFNTGYRLLLIIILTWIASNACCTLKFKSLLVACHHRNYLCCHLPTRGRLGIKLGDVDTSQTYLYFFLLHASFGDIAICFDALSYHLQHIWELTY